MPDCACPKTCKCIESKCDVKACFADAVCLKGLVCSRGCKCGDGACAKACAMKGGPKFVPLTNCARTHCGLEASLNGTIVV